VKRLLLAGFVGCAHAATPVTTQPVTLGSGLSSLAFYVGTWSCDGTENGAPSKDYPVVGVTVAPAYKNWISIEVFDKGAKGTSELMGVDPKGIYHHVWTDDEGGYGTLTSAKGWEGDSLVFDEDHPSATSRMRMTLKKIDATHYVHLAEVDAGSGYKLEFTKTCHKV